MIDYGMGQSNINKQTGVRYGVISQNEVLQAWAENSEAWYGKPLDCDVVVICSECGHEYGPETDTEWGDGIECPECGGGLNEIELPDFAEPISYYYEKDGYSAESDDYGDIFITESPYYTVCAFCSPCAPGAGYLMDTRADGIKAYCFGHEWFDGGVAPYPVYIVGTDEQAKPDTK